MKLVLTQGLTIDEAALRLTIPKGTLGNWVSAARRGNGPKAAPGSRTVAELKTEVTKLRKELAETRMERDIVKKEAAYSWVANQHDSACSFMPGRAAVWRPSSPATPAAASQSSRRGYAN